MRDRLFFFQLKTSHFEVAFEFSLINLVVTPEIFVPLYIKITTLYKMVMYIRRSIHLSMKAIVSHESEPHGAIEKIST